MLCAFASSGNLICKPQGLSMSLSVPLRDALGWVTSIPGSFTTPVKSLSCDSTGFRAPGTWIIIMDDNASLQSLFCFHSSSLPSKSTFGFHLWRSCFHCGFEQNFYISWVNSYFWSFFSIFQKKQAGLALLDFQSSGKTSIIHGDQCPRLAPGSVCLLLVQWVHRLPGHLQTWECLLLKS